MASPRLSTREWIARLLALAAVCLSVASAASGQTLRLEWDAPDGEPPSRYLVQWGSESGVYGSAAEIDGTQTTYVVAAPGETLFVVVRAVDANGAISGPSNELSVGVPAAVSPVGSADLETVPVGDEPALQAAVARARSGTRLLLAPGVYRLTQALRLPDATDRVELTSATGRAEDVVLLGPPPSEADGAPSALLIGPGAGITVDALTIRETAGHAITVDPAARDVMLRRLHVAGAGRFVRVLGSEEARAASGHIEDCTFEFEDAPTDPAGAIQLVAVDDWVLAGNRIHGPAAAEWRVAGAAIRVGRGSQRTTLERNVFVQVGREIEIGDRDGDHPPVAGTIVRNNMISRSGAGGTRGVAVALFNAPDTTAAHNTVLLSDPTGVAIEYAQPRSQGLLIANNLVDGVITGRDAATARLERNERIGTAAMFVAPGDGDLRLVPSLAGTVVDRGTFVPLVPTDIDGRPRPSGLATDIGAHELPPQ